MDKTILHVYSSYHFLNLFITTNVAWPVVPFWCNMVSLLELISTKIVSLAQFNLQEIVNAPVMRFTVTEEINS